MKLQTLLKDKYSIAAVVETKNAEDTCPVTDFLYEIESEFQSNANGILTLMAYIAENGLQNISLKQCHLVDRENKIFELIKGNIRIFFFKGHRDLIVIATHGIIKKSQKTKKSDTEKAVRYKKKYEIAHDNKNITIIDEVEE